MKRILYLIFTICLLQLSQPLYAQELVASPGCISWRENGHTGFVHFWYAGEIVYASSTVVQPEVIQLGLYNHVTDTWLDYVLNPEVGIRYDFTYQVPADGYYEFTLHSNISGGQLNHSNWACDGVLRDTDASGNVIVNPPDDRVNWQFGDDVAAIFSESDSEGNPALHIYQLAIYGVNPDSPIVITQNDFPTPMPPAENIWIAGEGLVNVYVLATGEIQVNMGPTLDGKVRVVIFPDLTGQGSYGYEYNVFSTETTATDSTDGTTSSVESDPAQDFMCNFVGTC